MDNLPEENNDNTPAPSEPANELNELDYQVQKGMYYTHNVFGLSFQRLNETESFVHGLMGVLLRKGVITEQELKDSTFNVRRIMQENGEWNAGSPVLLPSQIDENLKKPREVNCEERLHICKAACCKLSVMLSEEEVESGNYKWDLGHPYYLRRKRTSNYCYHIHEDDLSCQVYKERPLVCRVYTCADDQRIWKDFDNMVFNDEWWDDLLKGKEDETVLVEMPASNDSMEIRDGKPVIVRRPSKSRPDKTAQ